VQTSHHCRQRPDSPGSGIRGRPSRGKVLFGQALYCPDFAANLAQALKRAFDIV